MVGQVRGFTVVFQSTLPLRGATKDACSRMSCCTDFNPHSPCGERHYWLVHCIFSLYFNPHSPCGERRTTCSQDTRAPSISIHTPLAGSDLSVRLKQLRLNPFQSTLPLRGATSTTARAPVKSSNFNPHSPCGERRIHPSLRQQKLCISIHTPLAGSDRLHPPCLAGREFQSTLPLRGATLNFVFGVHFA